MSSNISVVIPFHNSDRTFHETLQSVRNQTIAPDEIIVVDDASAPGASSSLDALPTDIQVVRLAQNAGPGAARQVGSERATSEWIAYLDADDMWHPRKLERQAEMIRDCPQYGAIHCGTEVVRHQVRLATYVDKPRLLTPEIILAGGQTLPSCLVVHRDALRTVGGWTTNRYVLEDWDLAIRLVLAGVQVGFQPEPLTLMRREDHDNLTTDPWRDLLIHLACIQEHKAAMMKYLGPKHVAQLRLKYLTRFAWALPRWPSRAVRAGIWMLRRGG